uniref:Piwi domain-containing protein n=1 Tax=Haemonchus placei TaxID=6290 RepID=A0A0N4WGV4_HAEPC
MVKVVDILYAKRGKEKTPIKPIFISVDPERDTVQRVKEYYAKKSTPKSKGFTGSVEQVNKVAKTFRVYHSQGPRTGKDEDDYIVDHAVTTYHISILMDFSMNTTVRQTAGEIANVVERKTLKFHAHNSKGLNQSLFSGLPGTFTYFALLIAGSYF